MPRDISSILIIKNTDPSYKNSADNTRRFSKFFSKKKLLYAFSTPRGHTHLDFESEEESKEIEMEFQTSFLGSETICRRPRPSQRSHSVLIKNVPKAEHFMDVKLTTLLEENFSGAKARRLVKKDKSVLNTVKIDFPSSPDQVKTLSEGLFLNDQSF